MATKQLLMAALMLLAAPLCCDAAVEAGQAGLHALSGFDVPVGPGGRGGSVGEPGSAGLGNAERGGANVGTLGERVPNTDHQPFFISNLVEGGLLTGDQVNAMRSTGTGWGGIRISGLLAERIAGNDADMSFDTALQNILAARDEQMGFGAIALMNDLKLGPILRTAN